LGLRIGALLEGKCEEKEQERLFHDARLYQMYERWSRTDL
jgi:hypothetical protein